MCITRNCGSPDDVSLVEMLLCWIYRVISTFPQRPLYVTGFFLFVLHPELFPDVSRWFAVCCGGAGAGKEPAAGADPEPGGALSRSGGSTAAAGSHRDVTGKTSHTI